MKLALLVSGALLVGSFAMAADDHKAADHKATGSDSVETSKNIVTGTVTKTEKHEEKAKDGKGNKSKSEVVKKT
ncbi:MAG: hypothetical protein EOP06_31665, partial [Proteobacteria bacterium]